MQTAVEKVYDSSMVDKKWYKEWKSSELFDVGSGSGKPVFSVILPPLDAVGGIHMGHALAYTVADIVIRRKKMQGYDCLGLQWGGDADIAEQVSRLGLCMDFGCVTGKQEISQQCFSNTAALAKRAMQVVENGEITFIPEKWKKEFSQWMSNFRDLRISHVADGIPNSKDYTEYYPADLMVAGFGNVFLGVAGMIMLGECFGKGIPFREVLIHGPVRDETGTRLNGGNSNVVDPLEIAEQYGTDALRFTLAVQAVPGMDITLTADRVKGDRAFANKIWNASRYVFMNLKGDEDFNIDFLKASEADRWILNGLSRVIEKVNRLMDEYRVYKAADLLYHFFWHEYCDWYLEFSRIDNDNRETRKTLKYTLFRLLQLLHPFMPFITEEIFHKFDGSGGMFLLQTEFPVFHSEMVFPDASGSVEVLKKIVNETRKVRTENGIEPNRNVKVFLKTESAREKKWVKKNMRYFNLLAHSERTEIVVDFSKLPHPRGFRGACLNWEVLLPLENENERLNELERLGDRLTKLDAIIAEMESTLLSGAVQPDFKKQLQQQIDNRTKIRNTIDNLS